MKKKRPGRPRLQPGPAGTRSPQVTLRVSENLFARMRAAGRREKRPVSELHREVLEAGFPGPPPILPGPGRCKETNDISAFGINRTVRCLRLEGHTEPHEGRRKNQFRHSWPREKA